MEELENLIKYTLRCQSCNNVSFGVLQDGNVYCLECGCVYAYIRGITDWTPLVMNTEDLLYFEEDKVWDKDNQIFITKDDMIKKLRSKNKLKRKKSDES